MEEYKHRLSQFTLKHNFIMEHNAKESKYKTGYNQMSDWTQEEYEAILTHKASGNPKTERDFEIVGNSTNSTGIDLRDTGCVYHIQNQGQCGSCWAFSSVTSMETSYCLHSGDGTIVPMSQQQLVDCDYSCSGCNGGLTQYAFNYFYYNYAINETEYPYKGVDGVC